MKLIIEDAGIDTHTNIEIRQKGDLVKRVMLPFLTEFQREHLRILIESAFNLGYTQGMDVFVSDIVKQTELLNE